MKVSILLGKYRQKTLLQMAFPFSSQENLCCKTKSVIFSKTAQINYRQQANTMRKSYHLTDDPAKFSCNL